MSKKRVGRPKLAIDEEQLEKLASIDCSYEEMASILKCNSSTLTRNFGQVLKKAGLRAERRFGEGSLSSP